MHNNQNEQSVTQLLEALVRGEFNKTKYHNNSENKICDSNHNNDDNNSDQCSSIDSNLSEEDDEEERKREELIGKLPFQPNAVNRHLIYSYAHFHSSFAIAETLLRNVCTKNNEDQ